MSDIWTLSPDSLAKGYKQYLSFANKQQEISILETLVGAGREKVLDNEEAMKEVEAFPETTFNGKANFLYKPTLRTLSCGNVSGLWNQQVKKEMYLVYGTNK